MRQWRQQLASVLFHLPFSLNPAVFPPARPGGLWVGDVFSDPEESVSLQVCRCASEQQLWAAPDVLNQVSSSEKDF